MKNFYISQKNIITIIILIAVFLSATSCSGKAKETDQLSDKPITVTFSIYGIDDYLIPQEERTVNEGTTVFALLETACGEHQLELKYTGSKKSAYVYQIGDIKEKQHGPTSGWTYKINGDMPLKGIGAFILSDGDIAEIIYSKSL